MTFSRLIAVSILFGIFAADAQTVSVGITVGATPTNVFLPDVTTSDANNSPLVLGATVRLRARAGLGLEVGAFRKNMDHRYAFGRAGVGFDTYYVDVSAWDVPILVQYGRSFRRFSAYLSFGPSFRVLGSGTEKGQTCTQLTTTCTNISRPLTNVENRSTMGIATGGGVEFNVGFLQISPEFRYTHWFNQPFQFPRIEKGQPELLLRIAMPLLRK